MRTIDLDRALLVATLTFPEHAAPTHMMTPFSRVSTYRAFEGQLWRDFDDANGALMNPYKQWDRLEIDGRSYVRSAGPARIIQGATATNIWPDVQPDSLKAWQGIAVSLLHPLPYNDLLETVSRVHTRGTVEVHSLEGFEVQDDLAMWSALSIGEALTATLERMPLGCCQRSDVEAMLELKRWLSSPQESGAGVWRLANVCPMLDGLNAMLKQYPHLKGADVQWLREGRTPASHIVGFLDRASEMIRCLASVNASRTDDPAAALNQFNP